MEVLSSKNFSVPLGISWHEGMLLSQHHFQQNDLRNFLVLAHQLKLISWHHYGIRHLRVDNVSLPNGVFRIEKIEAVFPDGLIIYYLADEIKNIKPIEIDFSDKFKDGAKECTVFLTIAENVSGISPLLGNPPRFYSVDGDYVHDENIENNEIKIPRLLPNVFLYTGKTLPERCVGFPIGKVEVIDGVYNIKNWTPSCFFVEKHYPLWKRCAGLAVSVREKAIFLSEKLKNELVSGASTDTKDMLGQLLQILPVFEALVYSDHVRPYELYQELANVLGAVSVFQPLDIVPIMGAYNHDDIDGCIYPIIHLIEHYLSSIERGFMIVSFDKRERFFYHYMSKNESSHSKKIYLGIKGKSRGSFSNIEKWMNEAIIVSDFALESVRSKRVKGSDRRLAEESMLSKILPGSGIVLFEMDFDPEFVKAEQNMHVFNPGDNQDTRPLEILMYVPRKEEKQT